MVSLELNPEDWREGMSRPMGTEDGNEIGITSIADGERWTVFTCECEWGAFIRGHDSKSTRQQHPGEVLSEGRMFGAEDVVLQGPWGRKAAVLLWGSNGVLGSSK